MTTKPPLRTSPFPQLSSFSQEPDVTKSKPEPKIAVELVKEAKTEVQQSDLERWYDVLNRMTQHGEDPRSSELEDIRDEIYRFLR